jgi:acyl-CoA thioester hydrolase
MMEKEEARLMRMDEYPMRWGDMDVLGHMNNVAYFRYFEQARISWFDSVGISLLPGTEGPVLGTINCKFIKAAVYPVTFGVSTYCGKLGNKSFVMYHELFDQANSSCVFAQAHAAMVWIDVSDGTSRPIPDWMRNILQG